MKNRKLNRILKLADFMEKLPRKRFNFGSYVGWGWKGKADLSCGTTACAIGWASTMPLFRRLGIKMKPDGIPTLIAGDLGPVFGVDRDTIMRLFYPTVFREDFEHGKLPGDATPKQWAKHARKIVKELENQ